MTKAERDQIATAIAALDALRADLQDAASEIEKTEACVRICCSGHSLRDWLDAKRAPN